MADISKFDNISKLQSYENYIANNITARKEIKAIPLSDGQTNVFVCKNGTPHETCVACGDVIPEGRQVCPRCERKSTESKRKTNG
jgi:hypothetical protein